MLRGWVNYFAVGHSGACFGYSKIGGEEGQARFGGRLETTGLRLGAME
jgi:hypothetical protein